MPRPGVEGSVSPLQPPSTSPPTLPSPHDQSHAQPQPHHWPQLQTHPQHQPQSQPQPEPYSDPHPHPQSYTRSQPITGMPQLHPALQVMAQPLPEPPSIPVPDVGLPQQRMMAEPVRKRVPLHQGMGLVKLNIPDQTPDITLHHSHSSQQHLAAPMLMAKYADWPFTCLWPESPASQPPPLPSRSPSPMSFLNTDPSPPKSAAQQAPKVLPLHPGSSQDQGKLPQQPADDSPGAVPAAGLPKDHLELPIPTAGLRAAPRSAEKQAPKRLLDPSVGHSGLDPPFVKRCRSAQPDFEPPGAHQRWELFGSRIALAV